MDHTTMTSGPSQYDAAPDGSWGWQIVQQSGVAWSEVDEQPDGVVTVTAGDCKVTFGQSKSPEDPAVAEGYDWTAYRHDGDGWLTRGSDWAEDDDDMAGVLNRYL